MYNIDELFDKAKTAVNKAAEKTNEVVAYSKLKLDAVKLSDEISKLYERLGHNVYEMRREGYENEELIHSICEEIDALHTKLEDLNLEIAKRKNQVVCPVCGFQNDKESSYCSKCGSRLTENYAESHFDPREDETQESTSTEEPSSEPEPKDDSQQ